MADQAMVEFDLSRLPRYVISVADLDTLLRKIVPKWIRHPGEAALRAELLRKLEKKEADLEAARRRRLESSAEFRRLEKFRPSQPDWGDYDPPSKPVVLLATVWWFDVELLVKTHPLLDGVTIFAAHSQKASRERALCEVAKLIRSKDVTCSSRTTDLGYLIAWGQGGREWADSLTAEGMTAELRLDLLPVPPVIERL